MDETSTTDRFRAEQDYARYAVLYVDDEEKSLVNFVRAFGDQFHIYTAPNAQAGWTLLQKHQAEIAVLMTDQRMPGQKGVWLLEKARHLEPRILRILVTAHTDAEAAIAAVNSGAIYKYVSKPWDPPELETLLKRALDFYIVQRERDRLYQEKMAMLRNMVVTDRILSLGLLAAGMSHHIRNALVSVKTFLELAPHKLREEGVDPARLRHPDFWRQYWENALDQIEKINGMLRDLWAACEKPEIEFEDSVQLGEVLEGVLQKLQEPLTQRQITVHVRPNPELPALRVDRKKFHRLFELLLEDELGFLPAGSQITIDARTEPREGHPADLRIEIRDNGPGMPEAVLRTMFDPFVARTDSPSEYGIRLMACFFIVHYHHGRIIAQSKEGKGTTFILTIPTDPRSQAAPEESQLFLQKVQLNDKIWQKLLVSS